MNIRNRRLTSTAGEVYSWIAMAMMVAVCLLIFVTVFVRSDGIVSFKFLTGKPLTSFLKLSEKVREGEALTSEDTGGILSPIAGSLLITLIGIGIAYPLSLATAIYMTFYRKKGIASHGIGLAIDVLAGVPTIVIALFAVAIFTNPNLAFFSTPVDNNGVVERAYGRSFLVGGITMAIMVLPFVVKSMVEALKSVPKSYYDGAIALGSDKWHATTKVVLPSARRGLVTGVILGMGRILGDTAIVMLALGGTLRMKEGWYLPGNWIDTLRNAGGTITSYIWISSPVGNGDINSINVSFAASLVLIAVILLLNAVTSIIGGIGRVKDD